MSSFNDFSHLSNISTSTRISRTDSFRSIDKIDFVDHVSEQQQSSVPYSSAKSTFNVSQGVDYCENVIKSLALYEEGTMDYVKTELVFECVKEVALNKQNTISREVADKLKMLLQMYENNKYMCLPSISKNMQEKLTILGITNLSNVTLSYEEKLVVKYHVETLLRERIHQFIKLYESLGGTMKEVQKVNQYAEFNKLSNAGLEMLQWKEKTENIFEQYKSNLLKCKDLINRWRELKYKNMTEIYFMKGKYLLLQSQIAEEQAKITKLSCLVSMYMETPKTIDAYKTLNSVLDEKLFSMKNEIKKKEYLKKSYEELKNTEYEDVLKTYLHFCNAIKKKKHILQML